ncbi:MAG: hypothetical protein LUC93_18165 [Planctomycetaceae bacterium]|nr:hypothetical protein [Planctomycetaceae bacterium]
MKTVRFLFASGAVACAWVVLFLACRLAAWALGWPAWWTIPLALNTGVGWVAIRMAREALRDARADAHKQAPADPRQSARMRRAWKRGRGLRRGRFLDAPMPWYLCLEQAPTTSGGMLDSGDAADRQSDEGEEFAWRRGPHALWLDYPDAWGEDDDVRWDAFVRLLKTRDAPLAGIALVVEADHLLLDDPARLRDRARLLRRRLDRLRASRRGTVPVYVVLNRLDCLYGMRSLVAGLDSARLFRPLGAVRRERETPEELARRVIDQSEDELGKLPPIREAALLAPVELERLREPLAHFCSHLFAGDSAMLRGVYLASSAPGGGTIPPRMVAYPTFREVREDPPLGGSWFLRTLLREGIPGDAVPARRAVGVRRTGLSGTLAGLVAGSLVLCTLLTWSFWENRSILLSARDRAAPPTSAESLEPFLDLAVQTRLRAAGWRLPRFGMVEAERLADELQTRFTESYFDLKTVPGIDHVQETALAAGSSSDPREIGNALLLLTATREGISRNLNRDGNPGENWLFLHALIDALRLAGPGDMRQLQTYFEWAETQEWMPETRDALVAFEKYIIDTACGGDLSWLPVWIESLPGLAGVDVSCVWSPTLAPPYRVGGAWTAQGYRIAAGLLRAVVYDSADPEGWLEKREAFLATYRRTAIRHWREAGKHVWDGFRLRIADDDLPDLIRAAAKLDDPASRFAALARAHLLPMHDQETDDPDIRWLMLYTGTGGRDESTPSPGLAQRLADAVRSLGSDEGIEQVSRDLGLLPGDRGTVVAQEWEKLREAMAAAGLQAETPLDNRAAVQRHYRNLAPAVDPLVRAGIAARGVHQTLREASTSGGWDAVSPLASYDYFRYLAARTAALGLDNAWREKVFNPAGLYPGDNDARLRQVAAPGGLLERFLTGEAAGLWCWQNEAMAAAEWDGIAFPVSAEFLAFCQTILREGVPEKPTAVVLPFRFDAISVDTSALERPTKVELTFRSGGEEQVAVFQNYQMPGQFVWHPESPSSASIRIVFPSTTAVLDFTSETVGDFIRLLSGDAAVIGADAFPEVERDLRELGVTRFVLRTAMENADAYFSYTAVPFPELPHSVIVPDAAPLPATPARRPAFGPIP